MRYLIKKNSTAGKNKLNTKSKLLVFGFMLFVMVGLFSPTARVHAEKTAYDKCVSFQDSLGEIGDTTKCKDLDGHPSNKKPTVEPGAGASSDTTEYDKCVSFQNSLGEIGDTTKCKKDNNTLPDPNASLFEQNLGACGITSWDSLSGCIKRFSYLIFHDIPALLLWVAAYLFNFLISISLSSALFTGPFIGQAWGVVRDLSNIFFIFILLYIAIKMILGMGGSEVKKMIGNVVIMALLINFSMFFTGVIIDTSNILALIFYNKINVTTKNPDSSERFYSSVGGEKDIAGGLVSSFDPTKLVGQEFFAQAQKQFDQNGNLMKEPRPVPLGIIIGIILLSGAVMLVAMYVFFASGFFFLGRLIELWFLIIFSPFAFMSWTVPTLSGISDIGWKAWFDRLISASFMAPIFMFFLYFIFMLVSNDSVFGRMLPTGGDTGGVTGMITIILGVLLPSILICVLLLKAKKYAKKGAGEIGGMIMTGAKVLGGAALMAATGGAAMAGTAAIGGGGGALATKAASFAEKKGFGRTGEKLRDIGAFAQKSNFDLRNVKIGGKTLASETGMKVGEGRKGGWAEVKKKQVEKSQKRAEELEKRGTGKLKNDVTDKEIQLKEATLPLKLDLEKVDKEIEKAKVDLTNARNGGDEEGINKARGELKAAQLQKKHIRELNIDKEGNKIKSIVELEEEIRQAKQKLAIESDKITTAYAEKITGGWDKTFNFIKNGGAYSTAAADEASRKIRSGTKLDSGEKPK